MKKRVYLYGLLVVFVLVQVFVKKYITWFPDIILLIVIFAGIYRGYAEGLWLGLLAGFLRGAFSVDTFMLDIFLFPAVGLMSAVLARMFYRQNPAVQLGVTAVSLFVLVAAHTVYLDFSSGNDVALARVLIGSWRPLLLTIVISPLVFISLKAFWQIGGYKRI